MTYTKLVLSGGAIKGLAYLGVLKYLEEHDLVTHFHTVIGTSIGAFVGLLIILGYTSTELKDIFDKRNLEDLKDFKLASLIDNYGLDNGKKVNKFIKSFIKNKGHKKNISMSELYNKINKTIVITVTNVNTKQTEFITKDTHPDIPVYLAIRMSMNIPFIYTPVKYRGNLYVDGAMTCNFPINYVCDDGNSKVLGFALKPVVKEDANKIDSIIEYFYNVFKASYYSLEETNIKNASKKEYISIVYIYAKTVSKFTLELPKEQKQELYDIGYNSVKEFFDKN